MNMRAEMIKKYIDTLFVSDDETMQSVFESVHTHKLPKISVSKMLGKLLYILALLQKPQKILEIGTLAGYSTISLAKTLGPNGKLISLEIDPNNISVAKKNIEAAKLAALVEIREGRASDLMDAMITNKEGPFDLIFLDADKRNYPNYLEKILKLSRKGTLFISDNLIPKGDWIFEFGKAAFIDKEVYKFNQMLAENSFLETILIPTIMNGGRLDAIGISIVQKVDF